MNQHQLSRRLGQIAFWGKFSGIFMIVTGAIYAILGLFAFIVGAVPGVITVFLGYFLLRIGQEAGKLKDSEDENAQVALYDNLAKYLLVTGIMLIVAVALFIISLLFLGSIATLLSDFNY